MKNQWPFSLLTVIACLMLSCHHSTPGNANLAPTPSASIAQATTFKLASPAFNDGGGIPRQFTCGGANVSPPLDWSGAPANTKSFVLILDDPDAPGKTWLHWMIYDLPPEVNSLSENIAANIELTGTARQGTNDFKVIGYGGPCPPSGTHRYYFKLYALDTKSAFVNPGETKDVVLKFMRGHILAESQLMGTYSR